jgi:hypothetical protein
VHEIVAHCEPVFLDDAVVRFSETPPRWSRPSVPLGYHKPEWPARGQHSAFT